MSAVGIALQASQPIPYLSFFCYTADKLAASKVYMAEGDRYGHRGAL